MWHLISKNVRSILATSMMESVKYGFDYIGSEHLLLGVIIQRKNTACRILQMLGIEVEQMKLRLINEQEPSLKSYKRPFFSARAGRIIGIAYAIAQSLNKPAVGSEHLLLAILKEGSGTAAKVLIEEFHVDYSLVLKEIYGLDRLEIVNLSANQKTADKAIKALWDKLESSKMNQELVGSKVNEILHLLEYIGDQLRALERHDLQAECEKLKDKVEKINSDGIEEDSKSQALKGGCQSCGKTQPGFRVGFGYDVHRLVEGRKLILGGVDIAYGKGLLGHSDADVLVHSIMDAILGAAGLGDIGMHFPDNDEKFRDISSLDLLSSVSEKIHNLSFTVGNIDSVVIAQMPRISPHIPEMRKKLADVLKIDEHLINIKATTTEGLGFEGAGEGIAAKTCCLLTRQS